MLVSSVVTRKIAVRPLSLPEISPQMTITPESIPTKLNDMCKTVTYQRPAQTPGCAPSQLPFGRVSLNDWPP